MRFGTIFACVLLATLVIGCSKDVTPPATIEPTQPEPEVNPADVLPAERTGKVLIVDTYLTAQFFEPKEFTVNAGDAVQLTIHNIDVTHVVTIPSFDIRQTILSGQNATVSFTPTKKGDVYVQCIEACESSVQLKISVQ